jgi:hypothetical protein
MKLSRMRNSGIMKTQASRRQCGRAHNLANNCFQKQGGKLVLNPHFEMPNSYRKDQVTERIDSAKDAQ